MVAATFDTLKAKENLTNAGVEDRQATAIVDLALESVSGNVATKEDISDLKVEIAHVETRLMGELTKNLGRTITATGVMMAVFSTMIYLIMKI